MSYQEWLVGLFVLLACACVAFVCTTFGGWVWRRVVRVYALLVETVRY